MGPEQRLLLELAYSALHASSRQRVTVAGSDGGVFAGIEHSEWGEAQPPSLRESALGGNDSAVSSGRVSFVLGLHGPCASLDTACASALSCLLYTSPSPRDGLLSRMPSSA